MELQANYKYSKLVKSVDFGLVLQKVKREDCFRLDETTYTIDEVTDMLDGLLAVVRGEVESELINTSHTNILCMRQMFQEAEKWHLKLAADISELENRLVTC